MHSTHRPALPCRDRLRTNCPFQSKGSPLRRCTTAAGPATPHRLPVGCTTDSSCANLHFRSFRPCKTLHLSGIRTRKMLALTGPAEAPPGSRGLPSFGIGSFIAGTTHPAPAMKNTSDGVGFAFQPSIPVNSQERNSHLDDPSSQIGSQWVTLHVLNTLQRTPGRIFGCLS